MFNRIFIVFWAFCSLVHAENTTIKTDLNEFKASYNHRAGMRILPHGAVDQTKDSVIAIYGADSLLSYDRGFQIGSNGFGYVAHEMNGGVSIYVVACSKGNINSMTITGECKKGDWRLELIKLLEISIKELDKLDGIKRGE